MPARGGRREGSGRKPLPYRVQQVSVNLNADLLHQLDKLRGPLSRAAVINQALARHLLEQVQKNAGK